MFALLVFLFAYPFLKAGKGSLKLFLVITVLCIVYGISMEFVQEFFARHRSFDITDMIADSFGSFLGYFFLRYLFKKAKT